MSNALRVIINMLNAAKTKYTKWLSLRLHL